MCDSDCGFGVSILDILYERKKEYNPRINARHLYVHVYHSGERLLKFSPDGSIDIVRTEDVYDPNSEAMKRRGF